MGGVSRERVTEKTEIPKPEVSSDGDDSEDPCVRCHGSGQVKRYGKNARSSLLPDWVPECISAKMEPCPDCKGTGKRGQLSPEEYYQMRRRNIRERRMRIYRNSCKRNRNTAEYKRRNKARNP